MKETRAEERRSRKRERADSVYGRCQFYTSHVPKGVPFTLYFPRKSEEISPPFCLGRETLVLSIVTGFSLKESNFFIYI